MNNTRKIVASLAGAALLVALVVAASFWAFGQIKESADARTHTHLVINRADDLLSALKDAETGERGYLLTGDEAFLEPYLTVRDSISGQLETLRQLTLINSAQKHLDTMVPLIDAKLAHMAQNIELRRNNDMAAVITDARSGRGKRLMDSIRAEMRSLIRIEEDALAQHDAEFQSNMRLLFIILITASLFMLLFALSFAYFIYRGTQQRLKNFAHLETQHLLEIEEAANKQLQQTNDTLQVSEEKLAVTLNSIGDAVITTDAEARVTLLNPLAEQLTGWMHAEAAGRPVGEIFCIINHESRQPAAIPVIETLARGTIQCLANPTILIARDGSERAIADSCAPIRDCDGQVVGAVMVFRDVTERMMADEMHRASSVYARSLIEASLDPLVTISAQGKITDVNEASVQATGVAREQLIGRDFSDYFTEPDKARAGYQKVFSEGFVRDYPLAIRHTSGRIIDVLYNAAVYKDDKGNVLGVFAAARDITERRVIEAGLEITRKELEAIKISEDEAREYAESIINTVREPLIALDHDLRVVKVSRSFYEFFKVNPEETVGQLIYDLGNKQWDIPKLRELLETILPQKATFDNYEVEHDFATIGRRIMLLNARQIERVSGKERVILLAIEDITERREIEKGLNTAHEELKELADELNRAARVKAEFLANMSHELRTPLNSIIGFSEVLDDETFGPINEKQKKYVNNVLTSGKHLLLLINQILDMAKVEAGKMNLALSILPLKSILNDISMLIADMVSKRKIEMSLEIAEDLPNIEADDLKVKQIIYNLLSNAVKFTPDGGRIGMRANKCDSEIEVVVWDTGVGIDHENMEKIFEGFFRVETPFSRVTEGTGLGLPLSKKLVELHSGKFTVESKGLNKGASVRFTLPIVSGKVV